MKRRVIRNVDLLYFIIVIMIICSVIQNTLLRYSYPMLVNYIGQLYKITRIALLCLGIIHIIKRKQTVKKFLIYTMFLLLLIIVYYNSHYFILFDMFFIALFFDDCLDYKIIINIYLYTLIGSLIVVLVLFFLHLFPNSTFQIYRNSKLYLRESFGFGHPNGFARHIFLIISLLFLKSEGKEKIHILLLSLLITMPVLIYSKSMTAIYCIILIFIYILYANIFKNIRIKSRIGRIFKKSLILVVPVIMLFSYLIFTKGFIINRLSNISNTIESRYTLSNVAIEKYGIHLFGNRVELIGKAQIMFDSKYTNEEYLQVDNFFVYFALTCGIIAVAFFIIYYISIYKISLKKYSYLAYLLIIMIIYSFTENSLALFSSNFVFILPLCGNNNITEKED